jgi:hypothetical protein
MDTLFAILIVVSFLTWTFGLPVVHFIGFIRCFRYTLRPVDLYCRAALQAILVGAAAIAWLYVAAIASDLLGSLSDQPGVAGIFFLLAYVGGLPALVMWVREKGPELAYLYSFSRIPLDLTLRAVFVAKGEPALFARREDQILFNSAVAWWKKSGRDVGVVDEALGSAEARGRIIGAYLDSAPASFFIVREETEAMDRYVPVIGNPRVILQTVLLLLAALFCFLLRKHFDALNASDAGRMTRLVLNFLFGVMYSSDESFRTFGLWAVAIMFGSALAPYPEARWVFTGSVLAYFGLSLASLPLAYDEWSNILALRVSGMAEWGVDNALNLATSGAWMPVKTILTFSVTNLFGISLVVWPPYVVRLLQGTWSAEGHLFYRNAISRPDVFGGIRRPE